MTEQARIGTWEPDGSGPGPEHRRLEVFIGKWINEGETIATPDNPAAKIVTSDVYEWIPGRLSVLHTAYGRIGNLDIGGVEIIGFDDQRGQYTSHFFDSQGHVTVDQLPTTAANGSGLGSVFVRPPSSATTGGSSGPSMSKPRTGPTGGLPWT
jgi:hypothetical protein